MSRRQRDDLIGVGEEERVSQDEERICTRPDQADKGRLNLTFGASMQDHNLLPNGARRRLHAIQIDVDVARIGRVHQNSNIGSAGQ